jgi:hypothetical protein
MRPYMPVYGVFAEIHETRERKSEQHKRRRLAQQKYVRRKSGDQADKNKQYGKLKQHAYRLYRRVHKSIVAQRPLAVHPPFGECVPEK